MILQIIMNHFAIEKWILTKLGSPHFHKDAYEKVSFSPEYEEFSKLLKTAATASIEEGIKLGQRAGKIMAENVFMIRRCKETTVH